MKYAFLSLSALLILSLPASAAKARIAPRKKDLPKTAAEVSAFIKSKTSDPDFIISGGCVFPQMPVDLKDGKDLDNISRYKPGCLSSLRPNEIETISDQIASMQMNPGLSPPACAIELMTGCRSILNEWNKRLGKSRPGTSLKGYFDYGLKEGRASFSCRMAVTENGEPTKHVLQAYRPDSGGVITTSGGHGYDLDAECLTLEPALDEPAISDRDLTRYLQADAAAKAAATKSAADQLAAEIAAKRTAAQKDSLKNVVKKAISGTPAK